MKEDTVVVPAKIDGFNRTFLSKDCWYPLTMADHRIDEIKHIAAYVGEPYSAVMFYAPVGYITHCDWNGNVGKKEKYKKIFFSERAVLLKKPIPFGDAHQGTIQDRIYTTFEKFKSATKLMDLR